MGWCIIIEYKVLFMSYETAILKFQVASLLELMIHR